MRRCAAALRRAAASAPAAATRRVVAAWLLAAASAHAAVTVDDDRGRRVTLAAPPARIVTLLPSLTETVCALDACDRLVGVDRWSNWPAAVRTLPSLGGIEDTQVERIVRLKPDVVLAAGSSRAVDRLEALGIPVVALEPKSLQDTERVIGAVARVLGRPDAGPALWRRMQARIAAAATRVPPALRGRKVYVEVATTPYAAGASSFIGETLAALGMGNAVPAALGPFPKLNPEYVLRAQPDIVFAERRALAEMPSRPGWDGLRALREQRACGFEQARWEVLIRPGPRLADAADLMADCLAALPP